GSGSGRNVFGHAILCVDQMGYLHVDHPYGYPKVLLNHEEFARYLREEGKEEWIREKVEVPNPAGARARALELLGKRWAWLIVPHNCVAFCETILQAGGADYGSYSNLPLIKSAPRRMERALDQLERDIYQIYGVPRF